MESCDKANVNKYIEKFSELRSFILHRESVLSEACSRSLLSFSVKSHFS